MMAERAVERMDADTFLAWAEGLEGRFELVDGVVVAMAGAKQRHDRAVVNVVIAVGTQLRGKPCRTFTGDTAVRTLGGNIRRPDAGVDCGKPDPNALAAADPRLVVEVLSPSTRQIDLMRKLDEYRALPGLEYVLIIDPEIVQALLWSRAAGTPDGGWSSRVYEALEDRIELPSLGVTLALNDLYEDVPVPPRPSLVR
jgi:Uma2 family endonuclease